MEFELLNIAKKIFTADDTRHYLHPTACIFLSKYYLWKNVHYKFMNSCPAGIDAG